MKEIKDLLFENQDLEYKKFIYKLTPGFDEDYFIGVRNPITRSIAKKIYKENNYQEYMKELPHEYYEENMVHSLIFDCMKDYEETIRLLDEFLPYINNWAVCDTMKPKAFAKNKDKLILKINEWIHSDLTYTIRFGIEMLMNNYLDEDYNKEYLDWVKVIQSEEYYVNMMIAWYFATALAKRWDDTIKIIEEKSLSKWVQNKTIQKAIESFRITEEQKTYLRKLKL